MDPIKEIEELVSSVKLDAVHITISHYLDIIHDELAEEDD